MNMLINGAWKGSERRIEIENPATNQIKTVVIKVNGPVSLVETATDNSVINPENLNRCFVIGIDETEEQTFNIHEVQRMSHTIDGYLMARKEQAIRNRHIYAQRMLKAIPVPQLVKVTDSPTFASETSTLKQDLGSMISSLLHPARARRQSSAKTDISDLFMFIGLGVSCVINIRDSASAIRHSARPPVAEYRRPRSFRA